MSDNKSKKSRRTQAQSLAQQQRTLRNKARRAARRIKLAESPKHQAATLRRAAFRRLRALEKWLRKANARPDLYPVRAVEFKVAEHKHYMVKNRWLQEAA